MASRLCVGGHISSRSGALNVSSYPARAASSHYIKKSHVWREEKCKLSSSSEQRPTVIARADSAVPLPGIKRTTHSIPKDEEQKTLLSPNLVKRIVAGLVMGAIGATLVIQGGVMYLCFIEFFVCQAALEYFGFVSAVDKKEGIAVTPQWVANLVTLCCMLLPLWSFISGGKIAIPLALCSFVLLSAMGAGLKAPRMSTLSSAMFGLLYCGVMPHASLRLAFILCSLVGAP
jgi:phosphatidate cytidylyltransferase